MKFEVEFFVCFEFLVIVGEGNLSSSYVFCVGRNICILFGLKFIFLFLFMIEGDEIGVMDSFLEVL